MFKRYPYTGWFLLAMACWLFTCFRYFQHRRMAQPAAMTEVVRCDIQSKENALKHTLAKPGLVARMFEGTLTVGEINALADAPFYIYAFEQDSNEGNILIFWNSNVVVGVCNGNATVAEDYSLFRNNGTYLKRCIRLQGMKPFQTLVVLYPVAASYPLQNEYLQSSFASADYIPSSTHVSEKPLPNSFSVNDAHGRPLFYLQFKESDLPRWIPDPAMLAGMALAVLFTVTWVQLIAIILARDRFGRWKGLAVISIAVILLLGGIYTGGVPFYLDELPVFSTQLYAASSLFPSLGLLLTDMLALFWVLIFLLIFFNNPVPLPRKYRIPVSVLFSAMLMLCSMLPVSVLQSLVIDSRISFDVSNFYAIDFYTVIGLLAVGLIAGNVSALIYWINKKCNRMGDRRAKYITLLLIGLAGFWFGHRYDTIAGLSYLWLLVFLVFLDFRVFIKEKGLFGSEMIFWAAFVALTATAAIQYFNKVKEGYKRELFAENIVRQRDDVMEFLFADVADSISQNNNLKAFMQMPSQEARTIVEEQLAAQYLRGLNRYETEFYLFDSSGSPLFNTDTLRIEHFSSLTKQSVPVTRYLYFRENARDAHYYLATIPVKEAERIYGYVFIDMVLKKAANAAVYPELLQSSRLKEIQSNTNYTYAVYSGKELITQVSDHPFPLYRRLDTLQEGKVRVIRSDGYNVVQYKVDKKNTVAIVVPGRSLLKTVTLFSYMLGVLMILGVIAAAFRVYFYYILRKNKSEKLFHPTIRKRIHFAMLGIVFISFLIIGAVTIWVFVDRYNDSNKNRLRAAIKRIERSIQHELERKEANTDPVAFSAVADGAEFKRFLHNLANSQSIDINIYNALGALTTTSQDEIYNKLILARLMMPDPYYKLSVQNKALLIEEEFIGKLGYLSGYMPLRNEHGEAIGYVNVPYFSSQKELNYQISNILVALINFYAIIFLISSFFALIVTNWLTRGLQMIIERFQQFNLKQNEPLVWEYNDEIGLLVKAYNNMVKQVAESTSLLAQSERESAWREMARQVAHEIKNPLTPMKLNVQYLQQALQNNHPNVRQLTEQVTASLIEQIDSLSHIASAFSDFAKMPEAQPEEIQLNELLFTSVELYLNSTTISVHYEHVSEHLRVYADRNQLLRVFTNLLQNAVEAIPENRDGSIFIQLTSVNGQACISIRDNGNGISADVVDRIFSPYFTTKGSGTGLGLAMSKKIIEFWKGNIWFETKENEGTVFFIQLPLIS